MATTLDEIFAKLDELSVAITNEHMRISLQHAEILEAVKNGAPRNVLDELLERVEISIDRLNTFSIREEDEGKSEAFIFELGGFRVSPGGPAMNGTMPDGAMYEGTVPHAATSSASQYDSISQDLPDQHELEIAVPRAALP